MELLVEVSVEYEKDDYAEFIQEVTENNNEVLAEYIEEVLHMEKSGISSPFIPFFIVDGKPSNPSHQSRISAKRQSDGCHFFCLS
ncbi:hypothetical protein HMPREF9466_02136 [Fusobacterium necrophorum subsp. funduliforme 1_1_36S]|nr:hypothetical protein HMPREF9466_02136 [Fusobacterium necrophorum subsp. funduliforme 1_1_36S]